MTRKEYNNCVDSIIKQLQENRYTGDLSDIGNEIGIAIQPYLGNNDLDLFIDGLKHGISLMDGSHDE